MTVSRECAGQLAAKSSTTLRHFIFSGIYMPIQHRETLIAQNSGASRQPRLPAALL